MEDPIIENLKTICICKNVKKGTILKVIHGGSRTMEAVNKRTGAGSGACKGERCLHKIEGMIEEFMKRAD